LEGKNPEKFWSGCAERGGEVCRFQIFIRVVARRALLPITAPFASHFLLQWGAVILILRAVNQSRA
jgi:hypothetical protein